jgi:tetratricopeptide (TPR) repeat protein
MLGVHFDHFGGDADLEDAISYSRQAIELTPAGHSDLPALLNNLANSLDYRFNRYGEDTDLEDAINCTHQAIKLVPGDRGDRLILLSGLAIKLHKRFIRSREDTDLEQAIQSFRQAIELTPSGHDSLPQRLSGLAFSLHSRFHRYGEDADLEGAIRNYRQALKLASASHSDLPTLLNNLANSLASRFERHGEDADLEDAIQTYRRAIKLIPAGHSHIPPLLNNLANSLSSRFHHYGKDADLEEAISIYKTGSEASSGFPRMRFKCAVELASLAHAQGHLSVALEAYSKILDLLSQVVWFGQSVTSRQRALLSWQSGLVNNAVACAISLGYLELAVEFLDHGRSVFWSQATQTSADLTELKKLDLESALKFERLAAALDASTFEDLGSDLVAIYEPARADDEIEQRRRLTREFESLLEAIRTLPGLHNFMKPPLYTELRTCAAAGPVILLNASKYRSDALIVRMDSPPILVPLTEMSRDEATRIAADLRENRDSRDFRLHLQTTLPILWQSIVLPVLKALGFTKVPSDPRLRPHVWWCPTGPLSFLPIHAAGPYTKSGGPDLTQRVISSYTVTLQALLRARAQNRDSRDLRMLLVGQANTPNQKPLPGVSEEIKVIYDTATSNGVQNISRCEGAGVLRDVVVEELKGATCAHFACHGHQDQTGGALQSLSSCTTVLCDSQQLPHADYQTRILHSYLHATARLD